MPSNEYKICHPYQDNNPREFLILLRCGVSSPRPDAIMGVRAGQFDNKKSDTGPTQGNRTSKFLTTLSWRFRQERLRSDEDDLKVKKIGSGWEVGRNTELMRVELSCKAAGKFTCCSFRGQNNHNVIRNGRAVAGSLVTIPNFLRSTMRVVRYLLCNTPAHHLNERYWKLLLLSHLHSPRS